MTLFNALCFPTMPYNGSNPHSLVVMDNASIHHSDGIQDLICGTGALLIYLPPYFPDYNPIEELFSKLKTVTKVYEQDREAGDMDTESIIYASLAHISATDCQNWILDSKLIIVWYFETFSYCIFVNHIKVTV